MHSKILTICECLLLWSSFIFLRCWCESRCKLTLFWNWEIITVSLQPMVLYHVTIPNPPMFPTKSIQQLWIIWWRLLCLLLNLDLIFNDSQSKPWLDSPSAPTPRSRLFLLYSCPTNNHLAYTNPKEHKELTMDAKLFRGNLVCLHRGKSMPAPAITCPSPYRGSRRDGEKGNAKGSGDMKDTNCLGISCPSSAYSKKKGNPERKKLIRKEKR